ncbi:Hypothetical protein LUCI_0356 [Lucifera butyrica]|uniref:DUF1634 domain-containing protein n=1 Tax=Lucifera butyrica TaxID=1351585 RepID=A0A498R1W2_9FIRM|nr:DUF1634 domain-containing protein [Lucifera butyrica]VBB05149.1 Hypothetical protein LUCI_0356 [Lucifera butyrica]
MQKKSVQNPGSGKRQRSLDIVVSRCLRFGVILSAVVILSGLIYFFITGTSGYPGQSYPNNFAGIISGALQAKPFAIILTGLLILILTPIMRVGITIFVFIKEKDWLYAGISSVVFLVLITSFLFGKAL